MTNLLVLVSLLAGMDLAPVPSQPVTAEAPRTTTIYKSADSQGVDVIWLAACLQQDCGLPKG